MFDKVLKIINNSNFWSLISIIVVAITSYTVAKYNASKPNKLKIKQQQLDNVYLPLFRLFERLPRKISYEYALYLYEETSIILNDYYEFAFPQLHKLNRKLKSNIKHSENRKVVIHRMRHQIIVDYELLKKSLGYPSESMFKLFIRTSNKRKLGILLIFVAILFVIYTLGSMIYSSIIIQKMKIFSLQNIAVLCVIIFYIKFGFSHIKRLLKS